MKKNVYVVIASHGEYAAGIVSALKLLIDANIQAVPLCAYSGDLNSTADVMDAIKKHATLSQEADEELVVFTDIFGGSVTNTATLVMAEYSHMHVVAGVTLSMMMEFMLSEDDFDSLQERISSALETSREAATYLNENQQLKSLSGPDNSNIEKDFFC